MAQANEQAYPQKAIHDYLIRELHENNLRYALRISRGLIHMAIRDAAVFSMKLPENYDEFALLAALQKHTGDM